MQQKLVVCNSYFKKEVEKFITYNSRGNKSMLDYILVRGRDRIRKYELEFGRRLGMCKATQASDL